MEVVIDWGKVESEDDFYDLFLPQLKAPEWHGRNLDALADSVITGDINSVEPPYVIRSVNTGCVGKEITEFRLKVLAVFNESVAEGREIKVIIE